MSASPNDPLASPHNDARVKHWQSVVASNPQLLSLLTPRLTRYIPVTLTAPQSVFLIRPEMESLYGGAAGGGKSIALLAGALQYVDIPGYAALLLRRSFKDLALPGALMDVAFKWLGDTDARWVHDEMTWKFPSGATLTFGYLDKEGDKDRYQGSAYQYIGFDEAAQFEEDKYTYLISRLRRNELLKAWNIPLRMRCASNPGGVGHAWLKRRFMTEGMHATPPRSFVPAKVTDNPHLDQESYILSLMQLDPLTRSRLLEGNWDIAEQGEFFRRDWFRFMPVERFPSIRYVRFWDLSAQTDTTKESDWTVGALVGIYHDTLYVKHIARTRGTPGEIEAFVRKTAEADGRAVMQYIEQEGGSSGVNTVFNYKTRVLKGFACEGWKPKGNKVDRARVWSGYVQKGQCYVAEADWNQPFIEELELFPTPKIHDDQVDAVSGAVVMLLQAPAPRIRVFELNKASTQVAALVPPGATDLPTAEPITEEARRHRERMEALRRLSRPAHLRRWD